MSSGVAWSVDPTLVHFNHGSFGAVAVPTQAARARLLGELESDPGTFFMRTAPGRLRLALAQVAEAFGAADRVLLPVRNATEGVQVALDAMIEPQSDQVLVVTAHEYQSVVNHAERQAAAAQIPVAVIGAEDVGVNALAQELAERCGQRRPLLLISHISSSTAVQFPVSTLAAWVTASGGATVVDGAHAPGLIVGLDVDRVAAQIYVGNLHKWVGAPRAAGFIAVERSIAGRMKPTVDSWWAAEDEPLRRFEWPGTWDPTPWLAVPTALDVLARCATRGARSTLAAMLDGIEAAHADLGIIPFAGREVTPQLMRTYRLPAGSDAAGLKDWLREKGIVVWAGSWRGQQLLRLSPWLYNDAADAERYVAAFADTDVRGLR